MDGVSDVVRLIRDANLLRYINEKTCKIRMMEEEEGFAGSYKST